MDYLLFFAGFVALIYGAEWLIDGSRKLARHLGVSDLVVGLTIVAFGTSLPELIVNLFAGAESGELAIGNAIGSNIANILLILGVTAMIKPLTVHRTLIYREIIYNIGAAALLGVLVAERFLTEGGFNGLDRIDGIILMSYFVVFIYYIFGKVVATNRAETTKEKPVKNKSVNLGNWFFKIIAGIIGLWIGGQWIVNGAIAMAALFGVSDALVGLTIVAIGTSLPELAASVVAVKGGSQDIAVGNIVGSNLFNVFWVLGLGAFVNPLGFQDSLVIDIVINFIVAALLFLMVAVGKRKWQISKLEGHIMVLLYIAYMVFVVARG